MKKIYLPLKTLALMLSLVTVSAKAQTYCVPSVGAPTTDDDIGYVRFGTMSNQTNCTSVGTGPNSAVGSYANYTGSAGIPNVAGSIAAPLAIMGFNYPLQVGLSMCGTTQYSGIMGVYIDYDQNGVFNTTNELVYTSPFMTGTFVTTAPGYALASAPSGVTIPTNAVGGLTRMRVWESETSSLGGPCGNPTWGEVEDYLINIVPPTPCSGIPGANSVVGPPTVICPNTSTGLSLANSYTTVGLTYQWQQATLSNVGPFTPIPTATNTSYQTPTLTANTWYNAVITCTGTGGSYTTAVSPVLIQGVTTNTAPYFENFDGILTAGRLPNCSWASSNPVTCLTYTSSNTNGRSPNSGANFASFYNAPTGVNYFYTNGVYMTAGITYSAGVMYKSESIGYPNWTDLSILYGTAQTPAGLTSIVSTNGPAVSSVYKPLGGTFQVPSTGMYYFALRGTGTSGSAPYLNMDDFSVTIPCVSGSPNTPTVVASINTNSICSGDQVNLTVTGATTFTWNTVANTNASSFSDSPLTTFTYVVVGTNALTGCTNTAKQVVTVYNTPAIYVISNTQSVCTGSSANLQALGASSYVWSNGQNGPSIVVAPTTPTTYSVIATSNQGCTGTSAVSIGIFPSISVSVSSDRPNICLHETAVLTAVGGGVSFQWTSNISSFLLSGNPVSVSPSASAIYSVVATDVNGCKKTSTFSQNVDLCEGIAVQSILNGLNVYPNPTTGEFTIESNNTLNKMIEVVDLTGKVVASSTSDLEVVKININALSNGVYYVKVQSNNSVSVLKVVKQ